MELIGDIQKIKNKREDRNQDIEIHVDKISYITNRKDGHFFQPFEFVDVLDNPLVITGDCLSRAPKADFEEEDFGFYVYDKIGDTYTRNENKSLTLTLIYIEEAGQTILNSGTYEVIVPNAEFDQIKRDRSKEKKQNKSKKKS